MWCNWEEVLDRERARPEQREGEERDRGLKRHLDDGVMNSAPVIWGGRDRDRGYQRGHHPARTSHYK